MDDRTRETVLDPTYLQPGTVARGGAIALAAVGIGAGVLLACWGASLFFNTNDERLDVLITKIEEIAQRPDRTGEVIVKLDALNSTAKRAVDDITGRLTGIEGSVEELKHRPIIPGDAEKHETTLPGTVIKREVTIFRTVPWDNGSRIVTGWTYPDGASANLQPLNQYCYWMSEQLGGTTASTRISIASDGMRLQNIGAGVPRLEDAFKECVWWKGGS